LNAWLENLELSNPRGYSTYTSSFKKPFKKTYLTSILKNLMPIRDAYANNMQMAS